MMDATQDKHRKAYLWLTLTWVALCSCAAHAQRPDFSQASENSDDVTEQWLDELQDNLGDVRTVQTRFTQETYLDVFDDVVVSEGQMLFATPNRVRFEIFEPFRSVTVMADDNVVRYEHMRGEWKKLNLPSTEIVLMVLEQAGEWLRGRLKDASRDYEIKSYEGIDDWLVLTPRDPDFAKMLQAIEIELNAERTRFMRLVIRRTDDDETVLHFKAEQQNVAMPDEWFDTTRDKPVAVPILESDSTEAEQ